MFLDESNYELLNTRKNPRLVFLLGLGWRWSLLLQWIFFYYGMRLAFARRKSSECDLASVFWPKTQSAASENRSDVYFIADSYLDLHRVSRFRELSSLDDGLRTVGSGIASPGAQNFPLRRRDFAFVHRRTRFVINLTAWRWMYSR